MTHANTAPNNPQATGFANWLCPLTVCFITIPRPLHPMTDNEPIREQIAM